MDTLDDKIHRLVEYASQSKMQLYTDLLRHKLVASGVDAAQVDDAAQAATLELQVLDMDQSIIEQAMRSEEHRGIDSVGRIIVEYCFVRTLSGKMIWPEYSDNDTMARWQFTEEVLPRPLMRYFLVSVRGSIEDLDGFSAESMLFKDTPEELETLRQTMGDMLDDYRGPFGTGESAINWQDVYEDERFQKMALDIVSRLRTMLDACGLDEYLAQLEAYSQMDTMSSGTNIMQRAFTIEDARQIAQALTSAEGVLTETTH
ncbi:hypothetical protein OAN24_05425 [Pseudodesulfovibrio sp.]|nr:hypothetical protein [Pseudodesulfovibrio sp.]